MVCLDAPLAQGMVGKPATLVMLALSLLALGGTLIIHEPGFSPRTRRIRLCVVFAVIGDIVVHFAVS